VAILAGLAVLGAALAQTRAAGYAAAEQAVTKLEQEWFTVQLAHDWGKLTRMISDDFILTESDGKLGNRDSMLAGYKEEAAETVSIKMNFLVSHAVAANAVIATGLDDITLKEKNGGTTHRYERFTDTWIHRDGRWQCVAEQLTLSHP
jgi:ketosteroid isomerase-like protein